MIGPTTAQTPQEKAGSTAHASTRTDGCQYPVADGLRPRPTQQWLMLQSDRFTTLPVKLLAFIMKLRQTENLVSNFGSLVKRGCFSPRPRRAVTREPGRRGRILNSDMHLGGYLCS